MASPTRNVESAKISIVGCGNMGSALVRGLCAKIVSDPSNILAVDRDQNKLKLLKENLGVQIFTDAAEAVTQCDLCILAVKPNVTLAVARSIAQQLASSNRNPILVSVAAGITTSEIAESLRTAANNKDFHIARVMPNVAAIVGESMSGIYTPNAEDAAFLKSIFSGIGKTLVVTKEDDLDAITGLCASGPAFVFAAIEALADGGVKMGLSRENAAELAAQTVRGAATLVLETGQHPAQLKDMVASPGGTTIRGLHILENRGFRGSLIAAVEAAVLKAREREK